MYKYAAGEKKTRPGVYYRTSSAGDSATAGALNGVVAFAMQAHWGPVDKVTVHTTAKSVRDTYGAGDSVEAACQIFAGGATTVYIKRLAGAEGATGSTGEASVGTTGTLKAKYPGTREIKATVRAKLGDATKKEIAVTEGPVLLETLEFEKSADETAAIAEALKGSAYLEFVKLAAGEIATGDYTVKGTDPTITANSYADAFYALEPYRYNVLAADSIDTGVVSTLLAYQVESESNGKLIIAVTGDATSTAIATRISAAAACNSAGVVYFGGGWLEGDELVSGPKAIARVAGVIAATPSNQGIVHTAIKGATDVLEKLTNAQYVEAIEHGLLLVSAGPDGQVWFDSAINTLVTPDANQDEGWKKIRRVKTRYELMDRIDRTLAPKIGKINCDADGIAYTIQCAQGVIKEMIAENKLSAGSFYEDPENPYQGDSAWFVIEVDDIDSLEKIYLHYQFRYSAN